MSSPPKSLVKSRENLQEIFKNPHVMIKYQIFDNVLSEVWNNIQQKTYHYNQSSVIVNKYIVNLHAIRIPNGMHNFVLTEMILLELIEVLKKEYPGVDFTYRETAGYDGKIIEKIIVMDWS